MDEEDGLMLTDTMINYEETMEASATAESPVLTSPLRL
jgi:hypothetical protein